MYFLRLKRRSELPDRKRDTEAIYAAEDGTLMHMAPDGSTSELGGGGGGGGSQPVELVTVTYNFDDGLKTLAELNPGDVILYSLANVTSAFNGDTPVLYCVDDPDELDIYFLSLFDVATGVVLAEGLSTPSNALDHAWTLSGHLGTDADPSVDPMSTTGVAEVTVAILRMGLA